MPEPTTKRLRIALSAGGNKEELARVGLGEEHINELMVRIVMRLLPNHHQLAFGGSLNQPNEELTKRMIDATIRSRDNTGVESEDKSRSAAKRESRNSRKGAASLAIDVNEPKTWPLVNYSAWPFYREITPQQRAEWVGICNIWTVDPDHMSPLDNEALKEGHWTQNPRLCRLNADALWNMRRLSTKETDLRIVWGGRIAGAKGWMPGILEEVGESLISSEQKPVLILGGFGGCASLLATYIVTSDERCLEEVNLESCANEARDRQLTGNETRALKARFNQYKSALQDYHQLFHKKSTVDCRGVSRDLVETLLTTTSPLQALVAIAKAVDQLSRQPGSP